MTTMLFRFRLAGLLGDREKERAIFQQILRRRPRSPSDREAVKLILADRQFQPDSNPDAPSAAQVVPTFTPGALLEQLEKLTEAGQLSSAAILLNQWSGQGGEWTRQLLERGRFLNIFWGYDIRLPDSQESPPASSDPALAMHCFRHLVNYPMGHTLDESVSCFENARESSTDPQTRWGFMRACLEQGKAQQVVIECDEMLQLDDLSEAIRWDLELSRELAGRFLNRGVPKGPDASGSD
jgi:hypothetical protein